MSAEETEIACGPWRAAFAPAYGGTLLYLRRNGVDILRVAAREAVAADPRNAAWFACAPYFGRLAAVPVGKDEHTLAPTLPACDPDFALHGEAWISPWRVVEARAQRTALRYDHRPRKGSYPFSYAVTLYARLDDSGLALRLTLQNTDNSPMPAGLAHHPFFPRAPESRAGFDAEAYWAPPNGPIGPMPDALGSGAPAPLPAAMRDGTYVGFSGAARIISAGRAVTVSSDAPHLHLFAPAGEDYFCLEPVTHLPGSFATEGSAARRLAPGEAMSLSLRIGVED